MTRKRQGIEIVAGWQGGAGGEDFLRGLVERVVQQVLEMEMTSFPGADCCAWIPALLSCGVGCGLRSRICVASEKISLAKAGLQRTR
jgi:hypothetical protein